MSKSNAVSLLIAVVALVIAGSKADVGDITVKTLTVVDKDGKYRIIASVGEDGFPGINFFSPNGEITATLTETDSGPYLAFHGKGGKEAPLLLSIGITESGQAYVSVKNKDGKAGSLSPSMISFR